VGQLEVLQWETRKPRLHLGRQDLRCGRLGRAAEGAAVGTEARLPFGGAHMRCRRSWRTFGGAEMGQSTWLPLELMDQQVDIADQQAACGEHMDILHWSAESGCPLEVDICKIAAEGGDMAAPGMRMSAGFQHPGGSWGCFCGHGGTAAHAIDTPAAGPPEQGIWRAAPGTKKLACMRPEETMLLCCSGRGRRTAPRMSPPAWGQLWEATWSYCSGCWSRAAPGTSGLAPPQR